MNEEQIAKLARKRVEDRIGLLVHVAMYLLVNTGIGGCRGSSACCE